MTSPIAEVACWLAVQHAHLDAGIPAELDADERQPLVRLSMSHTQALRAIGGRT